MKEVIKKKLEKYNYDYLESDNGLKIKLGHSQFMIVDFSLKDKYIIKDRFIGYNFLTGILEMNLKSTMIYNSIGLIIATFLFAILDKVVNPFNVSLLFISVTCWIISWTVYYLIKAESFKRQLMSWMDKEF